MRRQFDQTIVKLNIAYRRRNRWYRVVSMLAAIVVFVTTYALILPAITLEDDAICGAEQHVHEESCYALPVQAMKPQYQCTFELHSHAADCFAYDGTIVCQYADYAVHTHDSWCYSSDGQLICQLKEHQTHMHNEACYEEQAFFACTIAEGEGAHYHSDSCFNQPELICQTEEASGHAHDGSCYGEAPLLCQTAEGEEHLHSETCFGERELLCQTEETPGHTHAESCFSEKVLECTLEEQPGHAHDENCGINLIRQFVCTEEEIVLHRHEDSCFDGNGELCCGMQQVLEHQHDNTCLVLAEQTEITDSQPYLICDREEHVHEESCYPERKDDDITLTYEVPEEYAGYIQSEISFPLTYLMKAGTSIAENGGYPPLTVINPVPDMPEYLDTYHWVTQDGVVVDETEELEDDVIFSLKLYPVSQPELAETVIATFVCDNHVLKTQTVCPGTVVSILADDEVEAQLTQYEHDSRRFAGWQYTDANGETQILEYGITEIQQDTVYYAVFEEYLAVTLHDIDPEGLEYEGSPMEVFLSKGSCLSKQRDITLFDGTPVSDCRWYTYQGDLFDAHAAITEETELFTYSYALQLNMDETIEALEDVPEEVPDDTPVDAPMAMAFRLKAQPLLLTAEEEGLETDNSTDTSEEVIQENESVSIVKRGGDALTASDFVVDGVDYGSYQWLDDAGNDVSTDDLVGTTLTSNYALTRAATTNYTITYNLNVSQSSVFGTAPTVGGETTFHDTFNSGDGTYLIRIPMPSSYMVANGNKKTLYQFTGWRVSRTRKDINAGETVNASWFTSNVNRNTTTVTLTAQWSAVTTTETVHFFVNVNCQVADVDGNTGIPSSGDFTPSVFSTTMTVAGSDMKNYWQGAINRDSYSTQYVVLRADSASETEEIDTEIRRLINGHDSTYDTYNGASVWKPGYTGTKEFLVEDFPSDEHVLSVVRDMVRSGTVIRMNGVALTADELTADNFTVRWNVCKYDTGDGWHIDGVLVGKQAHLTVKKTFLGDEAAAQAVKEQGFTITVRNTGNTSARDITLTLKSKGAETGANCVGYTTYQASSDTYTWIVPLEQENQYSIIENNYLSEDDAVQTSSTYTISNSPDAFTGWRNYPERGITNITAYAYASDVQVDGYQTVALRNAYVKADTLTINKIDRDTGNGLAGVSYRLTDVNGNELTLYKKPDASHYSMKAEDLDNGFIRCPDSVITTGSNGAIFLKLDNGTFILEEAFPTGYGGYSKITVTVGVDDTGSVVFDDIASSDSTIEVDGTLVDKDTATLTIRNVSFSTSVTAQKIWATASDTQPVTVALFRNGVAMGGAYQVTLNSANGWTYTWQDLPLYADGAVAQYALREVKIGNVNYDPSADTDGYAGYIVTYDDMLYFQNGERVDEAVWTDENGVTQYADNARLAVRNEVYRGQLVFMKVDGNGIPLAGATFRLYRDEAQTELLAEATSDQYGRVIFENLMPDTYYVMKESGTPDGYVGADALYKVRLSTQGSTSIQDTETGEALNAIVNHLDKVDVQVYKITETEMPLAGAVFRLETRTGESWTVIGDYETDAGGKISLGALVAGEYRLTETKPPDGYVPLDGPISFAVQNAVLNITESGENWGVKRENDTGIYTITVINTTGYALPNTGGVTNHMFVYAGVLLILTGFGVFVWQLSRKKGAHSY